jgi:hypothetical protein
VGGDDDVHTATVDIETIACWAAAAAEPLELEEAAALVVAAPRS